MISETKSSPGELMSKIGGAVKSMQDKMKDRPAGDTNVDKAILEQIFIADENIKKHFNEGTRCIEHNGFATRYIGSVDDILDEIQQAGFRIIDKKLKTRKSMDDQDELFVICSK